MTNLERTKLIDKYLSREMTKEEQMDFERLLSEDKLSYNDKLNLREEMELQQEIESAICERGLREMLQKEEAKIKQEADKEAEMLVAAARTTLWRRFLRVSASVAIAACFVGVIIIVMQVNHPSNIEDNANLYASAYIEMNEAYSGLKGCNDAVNAILEANELMQNGKYEQADKILSHALEQMEPIISDEQQAWTEKEDMLYLRALCTIKLHNLYRSRMLLTEVINMNSTHKDQAQQLLNQIKGRQ